MDIPKRSGHIQIKISNFNPSQGPPASSKAQIKDLKDMDVVCTFKINIESQNLEQWYIKDQWQYPNKDQDARPSQEPQASFKAQSKDLKDMDVVCTLKIEIKRQYLYYGCIKDHWPYPNQDWDAKPQ